MSYNLFIERFMKLFVFDLDFTLWNSGDTFCSETDPPYFRKDGELFDQKGRWIRLYPDTIRVLDKLADSKVGIAVASRSYSPENANSLLRIFDINRYFHRAEIYPGSKLRHLQTLQEHFSIPFNQIYFFDDEERNIADAVSLGVNSVHVTSGVSCEQVIGFL
jgi:magnesium-dependent phosphatase 1